MSKFTEEPSRRLVLSRRAGEAIRVDGPATIHVQNLSRGLVRLIIEAPASTHVVRTELLKTPDTPSTDAESVA